MPSHLIKIAALPMTATAGFYCDTLLAAQPFGTIATDLLKQGETRLKNKQMLACVQRVLEDADCVVIEATPKPLPFGHLIHDALNNKARGVLFFNDARLIELDHVKRYGKGIFGFICADPIQADPKAPSLNHSGFSWGMTMQVDVQNPEPTMVRTLQSLIDYALAARMDRLMALRQPSGEVKLRSVQ
jgi:hypothetical protein